jgi:hypothetical protein
MRKAAFALALAAAWFVAMFTTNGCAVLTDSQQVVKVYGTVTNAETNETIPNVNVDAGTSISTADTLGNYSVYPKSDSSVEIVFRRGGFRPVTKKIETRRNDVRLDIAMSPER